MFGRWVPAESIQAIIDVFRACSGSGWIFIICTKFPQRLLEFEFPPNVWIGTTIDKQDRVESAEDAFAQLRERDPKVVLWCGCQPMPKPIRFNRLDLFNRIVIGGASATQHSPEWHPPLRWIDDIRREARANGCSLFEKSGRGPRCGKSPHSISHPALPDPRNATLSRIESGPARAGATVGAVSSPVRRYSSQCGHEGPGTESEAFPVFRQTVVLPLLHDQTAPRSDSNAQ